MKVSFLIHRLNALPFYIPLEKELKNQGFKTTFILLKSNDTKYNSVNLPENQEEINKHIKSKGNYVEITQEELLNHKTDILFSLDVGGFPKCSKNDFDFKYIIIQNYSDAIFSCQYHKTEHAFQLCDGFYAHNQFFADILKNDLKFDKDIFIGALPCFWRYENLSKEEVKKENNLKPDTKFAVCFHPRPQLTYQNSWLEVRHTPCEPYVITAEQTEIAFEASNRLCNHLENSGHLVLIKQRKKNSSRHRTSNHHYIEDHRWHPSVSLDLLFSADISWGYNTSAIMDASFFGTPYINIEISAQPPIIEKIFNEYKKYPNIRFYDVSTPTKDLDFPADVRDTAFKAKQKEQINDSKKRIIEYLRS